MSPRRRAAGDIFPPLLSPALPSGSACGAAIGRVGTSDACLCAADTSVHRQLADIWYATDMTNHEVQVSEAELSPLVSILARRFVQRWDMYPRQYDRQRPYYTIYEPLHVGHLLAHLKGELTLGMYLLNPESQGRFVVLDADDAIEWLELLRLAQQLAKERCRSYLERSRRGGHLWLFLDGWHAGKALRRFGKGLLAAHEMPVMELFPKQEKLADGPGSLVRMPFGVHQATGKRYGFYTPDGRPLAPTLRAQLKLLEAPETVPERVFAHYRDYVPEVVAAAEFERVDAPGEQISDRIKAAITVQEFVGRYVALSANGRGHCPFHDDQHRSFAVNVEKNYWSCFAGCGGGSVIDFWMRKQDCGFTDAVKELAEMLLK